MPKRIIDGVTYNTDTATKVARARVDREGPVEDHLDMTLYVTRGGAFFVDVYDEMEERRTFEVLTRDEAEKWITEGEVELLNEDVFTAPPEAEAPGKPEATIYVRVPTALRDQLAEAAGEAGQSTNAYALRCFERCLSGRLKRALVEAYHELSALTSLPDGYTQGEAVAMAASAEDSIKHAWTLLGYTDNDLANEHGSMLSARELPERRPYTTDPDPAER